MAAPTSIELDILGKFREKLSDLHFDNEKDTQMFLMRFLRARNHNLPKAEDMLRKHLEWRKVNKIDTLFDWKPPQVLPDEYPYDVLGFDKEGCPILAVPCGIWDVRKVCEKGLKDEYVKYVDQLFLQVTAAMKASSKRKGVPITQFICIIIPDEFPAFRQMSSHQAVDTVLETVRRFDMNYPETLKWGFVVDAPKVFDLIFSVIKPLLNSTTLGKVTISSNEKEWKPALLNLIDEDQLCIRLGGTRKTNVPILDAARGRYKTSDRIEKSTEEDSDGFLAVTIRSGQKFKLQQDVDGENCQICWTFKTDNHDIGFSIVDLDANEELVPYSRVSSHVEPQIGGVRCSKPGKYTLIFDNGFSRFRSKVLRYRVAVEQQKSGEINSAEIPSRPPRRSSSSGHKKEEGNNNGNGNSSGNDSDEMAESTSL